jgi:hypothetical protein
MYTLCNQRLRRVLSSPERKIKARERRVVGEMTKILIRMLRGKRMKRER